MKKINFESEIKITKNRYSFQNKYLVTNQLVLNFYTKDEKIH